MKFPSIFKSHDYSVNGLSARISKLAETDARASGITAKRLRLLASLDRLQGFSDADYSKNGNELKAAGISSKFVRNCILKGGLEAQSSVTASLVQPLSNAVMEKMAAASVNEKKFNTKYLSVLDKLHAQLPRAADSAVRHLPTVDSVISSRTASLNKKNEKSQKASIATVYSSHKDGFSKDLADIGNLTFDEQTSGEAQDLAATADVLLDNLVALPKDKNGNRLKDILALLKNSAPQAQSDSSASIPAHIKDLRPHLFNRNGAGVSLYEALLPESEHRLSPQVQQILKVLRQKYITPHTDVELNELITGNRAFISAHKAQVPPLGAAWQDFFPQYAAGAGGLATIEKLVSVAESARGDAQNTMVGQLVDNAAALRPGLKHAYAALSLGMHRNIANDTGLRMLRNESIAQAEPGDLQAIAEAPANRSSHAAEDKPATRHEHSDAGTLPISGRQSDANADQPAEADRQILDRLSDTSSFRSASSRLASEGCTTPQPSDRSLASVNASAVASEVKPDSVKCQRQAWLGALKTSVDSNSSKLILSVPTRVSNESRGGNGAVVSTDLTVQTNGVRHKSFPSRSYSEQEFVNFLWDQVPEALKGGNDGVGFESLFKAAARGLFNKLCTLKVGAAQINTDSQQVLEFIVSENSIEIEKKPVPKPEDKNSIVPQLPLAGTGAVSGAVQRTGSERLHDTDNDSKSDVFKFLPELPETPNNQIQPLIKTTSQILETTSRSSGSINLAGNQLLGLLAARCGELATQEQGNAVEFERAFKTVEDARSSTESKISDLTEKFKEAESAVLEKQQGLSCGIHSINNLFFRPGMVSALQVLEVYKILENSGLNTDAYERRMSVSEIDGVLNSKDDAGAHRLISQEMNGIEFNVLSTLLNSWVVPAANAANISVGEFQNKRLAELMDTTCFGKRMIAHCPGHYVAVVPVPSKEKNAGNATDWEVRDSLQSEMPTRFDDFNALKKYLEGRGVGNVLLES